jgi:hypothetical protein
VGNIVSLGCSVAEIHHRYASIHAHLFGGASIRMAIATLTGRSHSVYRESLESLQELQQQLTTLINEIPQAEAANFPRQNSLLRESLLEYSRALCNTILCLQSICERHLQNDGGDYTRDRNGGQSDYTRDKIRYDQQLMLLEQLGTRLSKLFSRF